VAAIEGGFNRLGQSARMGNSATASRTDSDRAGTGAGEVTGESRASAEVETANWWRIVYQSTERTTVDQEMK
jgi:hypothetical protein